MEKAKKYAYLILLLLCVAVPLAFFIFLSLSPAMPQDLGRYEYFAVASPTGEEVVYKKGEAVFEGAAHAFVQASPVSQLPAALGDAIFLSTEWIRNGYAQLFRLYLSPAEQAGYLVDERGNAFSLSEQGVLFFLQAELAAPLLIGQLPPVLTVGDYEIPFSLCRWSYTLTPATGESFTVSSGEYTNTQGGTVLLQAEEAVPHFAETPKSAVYTVYSGADEILSSQAFPDLTALSPGNYQIILVAEWQRGNTLIRAGYSLLLENK